MDLDNKWDQFLAWTGVRVPPPAPEPEPQGEDMADKTTPITKPYIGDLPVPDNCVVVTNGMHPFEIRVDGVRFEHVAEDSAGRWIYAKSV